MQSDLLRIRTGIVPVAASIFLVMAPASALGQSITNPTAVQFDVSTDHNGTAPDGSTLVTHYELQFYQVGAAAPFQTGWLGKPAAASGGRVRVPLLSIFAALPSPGIIYEARVAAVGPGSTSTSELSNSFMFALAAPCTYSVAPATQSIVPGGGTGAGWVSAPIDCSWTAASGAEWITITSGWAGTGNGMVTFSAAANTGAERSGTLIVGGQTVTVSQGEGLPGPPSGFRVVRP